MHIWDHRTWSSVVSDRRATHMTKHVYEALITREGLLELESNGIIEHASS